MPPALLTSSTASSAQACWVGPNSEAGPLSAIEQADLEVVGRWAVPSGRGKAEGRRPQAPRRIAAGMKSLYEFSL